MSELNFSFENMERMEMKPKCPQNCSLALAMAYVPMQCWETPYEPEVALSRGTMFPSLDKPFIGEEVAWRG